MFARRKEEGARFAFRQLSYIQGCTHEDTSDGQ
jgi:hypothetical protein